MTSREVTLIRALQKFWDQERKQSLGGGGLSGSGEIAKVSSWAGDTAQARSEATTPTTQLSLSLSPVPLSVSVPVSLSVSPHL